MTRAIFHPADDGLLNYLEEEGMSIEPEYFLPTVPMVLINGADGIGTGRSLSLPLADLQDGPLRSPTTILPTSSIICVDSWQAKRWRK
jgi:hypothetical protein